MDDEAEDRFTDLARARLADTLSEAARLLSGPSPDAPPARRTERLGIDEVLLGLPRARPLDLVPAAEPPGPPATGEPEARGDGSEPGGEGGELRAEVDRLRADVDAARQRVDAAEARAEEHEAALGDLQGALSRFGDAGRQIPPYERPAFATIPGAPAGEEAAAARVAPLPVVAFALGTIPSQPAPTGALKDPPEDEALEGPAHPQAGPEPETDATPDPATDAGHEPETDGGPDPASAPNPGPAGAEVPAPETVPAALEATAPGEPAVVDAAAGEGEVTPGDQARSGLAQAEPAGPGPARDAGASGYSWAFERSAGRPARRRLWRRR